jgi:hypothetical protein
MQQKKEVIRNWHLLLSSAPSSGYNYNYMGIYFAGLSDVRGAS